ncbi:DUF4890 domain-containing protein [Bacteroides gallinaceum]|uniref:DUF4890 domain-containing protein n=1 Tax=Bacteroides gallinaceum TaxID=1462571 RepID=UPI0025AAB369|nr:DUF4890 domain-containing protein [Bacteroides gallinaceum]MDN0065013.1 DUF4890 domain-containing protein [Bacteroides gallinaceum]
MKRYICSLLLGMAFGGEMFAVADNFSAFLWQAEEQVKEVPNPEKMAKRRTDEMNELLQLSEKQYKKIYKLYLKQEKEKVERMTERHLPEGGGGMPPQGGMPPRMEGMPPSMPMKNEREDMQKQIKKFDKKLKKILTDEQYEIWSSRTPAGKEDEMLVPEMLME